MSFTFWDETDLTTQGSNSQCAVLHVKDFNLDLVDDVKPNVYVEKFFWTSSEFNSLEGNSRDNGHIELESDLAGGTWTDDYTADAPKVSGKIVIRGTAYDDVRLKTINVQYGTADQNGTGSVLAATYAKNAATGTMEWTIADLSAKGMTFKVYDNVGATGATKMTGGETDASGTRTPDTAGNYFHPTNNLATKDSLAYFDQRGHKISWELTVDTQVAITSLTKIGVVAKVVAVDSSDNSSDGRDASPRDAAGADDSGDSTLHNDSYTMDVVPYITKVETKLSKQKKSNWSVYNRSALGHYPVQSVVSNVRANTLKTTSSEDVTLHGFNIAKTGVDVVIKDKDNNNITVTGTSATDTALGTLKFNVANLASGELNATVGGIPLINNINNNDAKGDATVAGSANSNWYNFQGNGDTNNILTDDLVFDVWEFNDRAAVPINGMATGVQMQVNQVSKMLNFAFANGGLYYSMGDGTYSSRYWAGDWDTFAGPCVGLGVDSLGYTYSVDSGGDTNNSGSVDKYDLYTSRWGLGNKSTTGTLSGNKSRRLEEIAIKTGDGTYDYSLMKYRYLSSELATSVSGNTTNLYLVNYDALTDEIRFRAGAFANNTVEDKGGFVDEYTASDGKPKYYSTTNCQVIANNSSAGGRFGTTNVAAISGRGAGQYVDVAVATNGTGNKDVACVVWYDAYDNCLKYTYYVNPIGNWDSLKGNRTAAGWSPPKTIFAEGGEYCQIAVDKNNHIHIAAYAGNGDVKYAYLDKYDSAYSEAKNSCTVDASGAVGEHLTLDVALDDSGNSIPYIGYFTAAIKAPKYAYLIDTTHANKVPEGVDDNERFTGAWEVTVVPTPSRVTTNREDKINIGVFKTTTGVLNWSTTNGSQPAANGSNIGTNECSSSAKGYGDSTETSKAYGNGSKNAVFAYQISGGTGSCIETAQMR